MLEQTIDQAWYKNEPFTPAPFCPTGQINGEFTILLLSFGNKDNGYRVAT